MEDDPSNLWVTVFGFGVDDTNVILREFEKCGHVAKKVYSPGEGNWMHLQYETAYDAQRALAKSGMQLTPHLLVGVKKLEPQQLSGLLEGDRLASIAFGANPAFATGISSVSRRSSGPVATRPHVRQGFGPGTGRVGVAEPVKSGFAKMVDFIFGF
eukprot:SM000156S02122  [mRNA]  locus=s156:9039:10066:- [translate_table: standard]